MDLFDIPVTTIDGRTEKLAAYRGRVLLVVNVASRCGFTGQYEELEALYRKHKDAGLVVLGFPCDQFLNQEPGDEAAIREFCSTKFAVSFPLFAKVDVNGSTTHPLYAALKSARRGTLGTGFIKWNFSKFLIARDGTVAKRFGPFAKGDGLERAVVNELNKVESKPKTV